MNRFQRKKMIDALRKAKTIKKKCKANHKENIEYSKAVGEQLKFAREFDWGDEKVKDAEKEERE